MFPPAAPYAPDAHGVRLGGVTIRAVTPDDVPDCADLLRLRDAGACQRWEDRITSHLDDGEPLFLAEYAREVIGYARLSWQTPVAQGGYGAPDGYYLSGMIVHPRFRRRGVGRGLTRARTAWTKARLERAFFVVNAANRASMDLHRELGYYELTRDFSFPGVCFVGGQGVLFAHDPLRLHHQVTQLRVGAAR